MRASNFAEEWQMSADTKLYCQKIHRQKNPETNNWNGTIRQNMHMRITNTRWTEDYFEIQFEDTSQCICIQSGIHHVDFQQVVGIHTNLHTNRISGIFIDKGVYDEVLTPTLCYDHTTDNLTVNLVTPESIPPHEPPPSYDEPRITLLPLAHFSNSIGAIRIHNASQHVAMNEML